MRNEEAGYVRYGVSGVKRKQKGSQETPEH